MLSDAKKVVQTCNDCQKHTDIPGRPAELMTPVSLPCTFSQWGIDIVGPFPQAKGQVKFLVVAIDYFT